MFPSIFYAKYGEYSLISEFQVETYIKSKVLFEFLLNYGQNWANCKHTNV